MWVVRWMDVSGKVNGCEWQDEFIFVMTFIQDARSCHDTAVLLLFIGCSVCQGVDVSFGECFSFGYWHRSGEWTHSCASTDVHRFPQLKRVKLLLRLHLASTFRCQSTHSFDPAMSSHLFYLGAPREPAVPAGVNVLSSRLEASSKHWWCWNAVNELKMSRMKIHEERNNTV